MGQLANKEQSQDPKKDTPAIPIEGSLSPEEEDKIRREWVIRLAQEASEEKRRELMKRFGLEGCYNTNDPLTCFYEGLKLIPTGAINMVVDLLKHVGDEVGPPVESGLKKLLIPLIIGGVIVLAIRK